MAAKNDFTSRSPGVVQSKIAFSHPTLAGYTWEHCEITGVEEGPRLCVSAGVHVNEVAGIEAAVRLQRAFDPSLMRGSVSIIPVLNQPARFEYTQLFCPVDGKNINFTYPGSSQGTFSEVLCHAVMTEWTQGADCYIDLHGGDLRESMSRFSMYQRTGDPDFDQRGRQLAMCYDAEIVMGLPIGLLDAPGRAPTGFARVGRHSIMSEAGSNGIPDEDSVTFHMGGVLNIARLLGILPDERQEFTRARVPCDDYIWVNANSDGEFHSFIVAGQRVKKGQCVGVMQTLFGDVIEELVSPADGLVLWHLSHPTIRAGTSVFAVAVEERDRKRRDGSSAE